MHIVRLFGGATIERPDGSLAVGSTQRARMALVTLLCLTRPRPTTRDRVMAVLWPEHDTERARHLLRDAIYRLREALGEQAIRGGEELTFDPAHVDCDVWRFEDAVQRRDFAEADRLYVGPLLDGVFLNPGVEFQYLCDTHRSRLSALHATVLESLADAQARAADWNAAIAVWRRLAVYDPHNARFAIGLMQALTAAGDRAAALKHAASYTDRLRTDFDADPDPRVVTLASDLRRNAFYEQSRTRENPAPPASVLAPRIEEPSANRAPLELSTPNQDRGAGSSRAARRRIALVAAATAIALLGTSVWLAGRAGASPEPLSVAVVPAPAAALDSGSAYVAEGMAEDITNVLAASGGLTVKLSRSVIGSGMRERPLGELARALGVSYVVSIAARRDRDTLRITAFLTRSNDGMVLWSERYDRRPDAVFSVQNDIAQSVVTGLRAHVARAGWRDGSAFGTENTEAYDYFLRAKYFLGRRGSANLQLAAQYFQRAIALAPSFARAHAGLAASSTLLTLYDGKSFRRDTMLPFALREADRAIELDPDLGEAHAALAQALTYSGRRADAERAYRRAVALGPNDADAHQWFAELLITEGRIDEAIAEMEHSIHSDPLSAINYAVAGNHYRIAGRFAEALRYGERAVELNSTIPAIWEFYGHTLFFAGLRDSAQRVFARHSPHHVFYAYIRARNGDLGVRDSVRRVTERGDEGSLPLDGTVAVAVISLATNNASGALTALERAASADAAFPLHHPLVDQVYDPLRDSSRFLGLVRRAGLDEQLHLRPRR